MQDLFQLISASIINDVNEQDNSVVESERISDIFAPGENIFFTNSYLESKNSLPLPVTSIQGTRSLADLFEIDEDTEAKLSFVRDIAGEYFKKQKYQNVELLKTKIMTSLHIKLKDGSIRKMLYHELATEVSQTLLVEKSLSVFTNTTYLQIPEGTIYLMDILKNEVIDQIQYNIEGTYFVNKTEYLIITNTILGYSNEEISGILNLSDNTVRKYRKNIIKKTDCKNLFQVIKKFHQNKIKPKVDIVSNH